MRATVNQERYTQTCIYTQAQTRVHTQTQPYANDTCAYKHTHTHTHTCIHTHMHTCMWACMHKPPTYKDYVIVVIVTT